MRQGFRSSLLSCAADSKVAAALPLQAGAYGSAHACPARVALGWLLFHWAYDRRRGRPGSEVALQK